MIILFGGLILRIAGYLIHDNVSNSSSNLIVEIYHMEMLLGIPLAVSPTSLDG